MAAVPAVVSAQSRMNGANSQTKMFDSFHIVGQNGDVSGIYRIGINKSGA